MFKACRLFGRNPQTRLKMNKVYNKNKAHDHAKQRDQPQNPVEVEFNHLVFTIFKTVINQPGKIARDDIETKNSEHTLINFKA